MQSHAEAGLTRFDSNSPNSKSPVVYDPVSPEAHLDPYPIYQQLRDHHPLYYIAKHDAWATCSSLTKVEAQMRYVALVSSIDPNFAA